MLDYRRNDSKIVTKVHSQSFSRRAQAHQKHQKEKAGSRLATLDALRRWEESFLALLLRALSSDHQNAA